MDVTVENFEQTLELFQQSLKRAHYISFDTEFTGNAKSLENKPHDFDTLQDKYRKHRITVNYSLAFQIGISTFEWCDRKRKYQARPFNFYVYPRSLVKDRNHGVSVSFALANPSV